VERDVLDRVAHEPGHAARVLALDLPALGCGTPRSVIVSWLESVQRTGRVQSRGSTRAS
jgi:hypothetical protein